MFIHESANWPLFRWDIEKIDGLQMKAMHSLGYLAGRMSSIGFDSRLSAVVEVTTHDVVSSSAIEGINLNKEEVRSSVARKLGVQIPISRDSSHYVDGIVEMMLDATRRPFLEFTVERLFKWHKLLFPGNQNVKVGAWRTDEMTVVSGAFGRERIHYRAPAPEKVASEMSVFLDWMSKESSIQGILKSAIAHLWFVSIHPFDDGNGRIARAISDMILASLDAEAMHFYSLSTQILKDKNRYYKILETTQRGDGEITAWLEWYFNAFLSAIEHSNALLSGVLRKAIFWNTHSQTKISERQRMVLNKYLDGYDAKLTAKNWEKIAGVSKDTALRDIDSLVKQGILRATPGRVRDIPYSINFVNENEISLPISGIYIEKTASEAFINGIHNDTKKIRERLSKIDLLRFDNNEITLQDLAYKYFAYLAD